MYIHILKMALYNLTEVQVTINLNGRQYYPCHQGQGYAMYTSLDCLPSLSPNLQVVLNHKTP